MKIHGIECEELTKEQQEKVKKVLEDYKKELSRRRGGLIPPPASSLALRQLEERVAKLEQLVTSLLEKQ